MFRSLRVNCIEWEYGIYWFKKTCFLYLPLQKRIANNYLSSVITGRHREGAENYSVANSAKRTRWHVHVYIHTLAYLSNQSICFKIFFSYRILWMRTDEGCSGWLYYNNAFVTKTDFKNLHTNTLTDVILAYYMAIN